jgi:thymidylate synthase
MVPKELHSQVNLFDNERIRYWGDSDEGIWDVIEYMRENEALREKSLTFWPYLEVEEMALFPVVF